MYQQYLGKNLNIQEAPVVGQKNKFDTQQIKNSAPNMDFIQKNNLPLTLNHMNDSTLSFPIKNLDHPLWEMAHSPLEIRVYTNLKALLANVEKDYIINAHPT